MSLELFEGFSELGLRPLPADIHRESMISFVDELNKGRVNDVVGDYSKKGAVLNDREFYIESPYARSRRMEHGSFFRDGQVGIILGVKSENSDKKSLDLAMVGVDFTEETSKNPIIIQLQTFSRKRNEQLGRSPDSLIEAYSILDQLRWEKILVSLAMLWANKENFPFIYLLPGNRNEWLEENKELKDKGGLDRFKLRYDVTAKRMGFEMYSGIWRRKP